jgi:hypothetical protein
LPGAPIKIRAVRVPGGAPLFADFDIHDVDKTKRFVHRNATQMGSFPLAPGKYRVEAKFDNAKLDYPFEVSADKNPVLEVAFNSGKVVFNSFTVKGGPSIPTRVQLTSEDGKRKLDNKPGESIAFELSAGRYQAQVYVGNATVTRSIEIKPGDDIQQDVFLNVGRIKLKAVANAGGPALPSTRLYVHETTANGSVGKVVKDLPNDYEFVLAAGTYVLKFKNGKNKVEKKFSVQAGKQTTEEVVAAP